MTARDLIWDFRIRKDGSRGQLIQILGPEYAPLNKCDSCGTLGTARRVRYRPVMLCGNRKDVTDWLREDKNVFCMPCWNKARAISNRMRGIEMCKRAINQIKREITNERKQRQ